MKNNVTQEFRTFFQETSVILLITYLTLQLIETYRVGSISTYINLRYLIIIGVISGVASFLFSQKKKVSSLTSRTGLHNNNIVTKPRRITSPSPINNSHNILNRRHRSFSQSMDIIKKDK